MYNYIVKLSNFRQSTHSPEASKCSIPINESFQIALRDRGQHRFQGLLEVLHGYRGHFIDVDVIQTSIVTRFGQLPHRPVYPNHHHHHHQYDYHQSQL